jgi:diguanylate cyclase (GGDEF)-like protein/PAS domain S-box-containing protein
MLIDRSQAINRGFPLRLFAAAFAISVLGSIFGGWQVWQTHKYLGEMSRKHVDITRSVGRIMLFDEALTMSARMAAATGDINYEKRYDLFDPLLETEIKAVRTQLPQLGIERFVKETDEANRALVKMERQAFALVRHGRKQEALTLLTGDEYMRLKRTYADGMGKTVNAVAGLIKKDTRHLLFLFVGFTTLSVIGVIILLVTWFFTIRSASRWAAERIESEDALRKARDELEVRVKHRTTDLVIANEQLQNEISAHKRVEETLRQSEESKRLLLHAVGEGIFGVDATGRATFINPAALFMLGFAEEEMLGQFIHGLIHHSREDGSHYPLEDCPMYASYTKGVDRRVTDEVFWSKGGNRIPVEYSSTPLIRDNKVMGAVVNFRDITERKLAEEALRESESRMRAITDSAHNAMLMMDPEGRISYWNPAAERILGYTSAEAIGQKLHPLIAPSRYHDAHHAAFPLFQQTGQGAAVGKTVELEARRKDGTEISVQLSLSAVHMKGAWHAVGILRDITERKRMDEALRKSEAMLNKMGEVAQVGGWEFDVASKKQVWTKEVYLIHEVDESYEPTVSKGIEFYAPAARPVIEKAVQRAIVYGEPFDLELEIITAKGNHRWVHAKGNPHRENGITEKVSGFFQDITKRKRAEEALQCSETKFRTLYDSNSDAVMLLNMKGFFDCNKAALKIFGCATMAEFCSQHPSDLSPSEQPDGTDSLALANRMIATAMERGSIHFEWMHKRSDTGETFPADVLLTAMELNSKPVVQAVVRDITERKRMEEKIRQLAYHDALTGLPNRKLFSDRLAIALAQARRNQKRVGLAMLDLDHFKSVNDTLGHDVGDLLLQATAERLSAALRKGDTVARFGGDEFVLILPDLASAEDAIPVAQKIVDSFCRPFLPDTHQLVVTTSIGIAVYPDDGTDEGLLLKNADIAMYTAKAAGRNRYLMYDGLVNSQRFPPPLTGEG